MKITRLPWEGMAYQRNDRVGVNHIAIDHNEFVRVEPVMNGGVGKSLLTVGDRKWYRISREPTIHTNIGRFPSHLRQH